MALFIFFTLFKCAQCRISPKRNLLCDALLMRHRLTDRRIRRKTIATHCAFLSLLVMSSMHFCCSLRSSVRTNESFNFSEMFSSIVVIHVNAPTTTKSNRLTSSHVTECVDNNRRDTSFMRYHILLCFCSNVNIGILTTIIPPAEFSTESNGWTCEKGKFANEWEK